MILNFVTPQDDELWYSVLSRYHKDSGNTSLPMTERELFGMTKQKIATVMPNITMIRVLDRLPPALFSFEELVSEHTLFHFYRRFETEERKRLILSEIREGKFQKNILYQYRMKSLCYCPLCQKEEKEKYGESYWHTSHQIPALPLCPRHRCKLRKIEFENEWDCNEHFYLPEDWVKEERRENQSRKIIKAEERLTKTLYEIWNSDLTVSLKGTHNNIVQELYNRGYYSTRNPGAIHRDRLVMDLKGFYGEDLFQDLFGEQIETYTLSRFQKWKMKDPVFIGGLLAFLNLSLKDALSETPVSSDLKKKFQECQEKGIETRKETAAYLGISPSSVNTLAKQNGIVPVWKGKEKRKNEVKLFFTDSEWKRIQELAENQAISRFLHDKIAESIL